jgi:predicted RNase H-like HicB family nuclease
LREKNAGAAREEGGKSGVERSKMKSRTTRSEPTPVEMRKENKHFFFCCPELDLCSVGRTREEAEEKLKEEIALLLTRCSEYAGSAESLNGSGYPTVEVRPS